VLLNVVRLGLAIAAVGGALSNANFFTTHFQMEEVGQFCAGTDTSALGAALRLVPAVAPAPSEPRTPPLDIWRVSWRNPARVEKEHS
jgi:hypothetical protein